MTKKSPSSDNAAPRVPKFLRLRPHRIQQLESASELGGIDQQQIIEDALDLYFNPGKAPAADAQRKALLTRIRLASADVRKP